MAMKGWKYGSAMSADKKTWRYLSPSTLMAADPSGGEGCLRKVYYEKVKGLKPPEMQWQTLGRELHEQNENYLLTGVKNMGSLALSGLHMLPKPKTVDPRIEVEFDIAGGDLTTTPLRSRGIPIVGSIDCVHWQGTNAGTNDINDIFDPEGTVEVVDWKTTSNEKWIKSPHEVAKTLQMTTYGKWAALVHKADYVRLSHGYYITKGTKSAPRKVSLRLHKDQIDERWEYVEQLTSSLIEIAKEDDADHVPANLKACGAFKGCPHRSYCSAASHNSLAGLLGADFAASILGLDKPSDSVFTLPTTEELSRPENKQMSLLSKLQSQSKPEVKSEMQRLAAEEVDKKYPGIGEVITKLESLGLGLPTLTGEAARVYIVVRGVEPVASGELAEFPFDQPSQLVDVLAEAQTIVASRAVPGAATSAFPEDAPPAMASPPVEEVVEAKPEPVTTVAEAFEVAAGEKKPTKRGKKAAAPAEPTVTPVTTIVNITGNAPDLASQLVATMAPSTVGTSYHINVAETVAPTDTVVHSNMPKAINLFVDCIPTTNFKSFWPIVNGITERMAKEFGGSDYRTCDANGPLGFGRWKGVVSAALQAITIDGGNYLLDGATTELGMIVVEAMRSVVANSGGFIVRRI